MVELNKIISEIDNKCIEGNKILAEIAYASTKNVKQIKKLYYMVKLADRYACLLDYYYETGNYDFYKEAKNQKEALFKRLDNDAGADLNRLERKLLPYFNYEKELKKKIKVNIPIAEREIKNYILKQSSDAYYSGRLLKIFAPKSDGLIKVFHYRLALSDVWDDLNDFEEDFRQDMPNILYLFLYNQNPNVPSSRLNALIVAKNSAINQKIIRFADELLNKTKKTDLTKYPLLEKSINQKYHKIVKLLK